MIILLQRKDRLQKLMSAIKHDLLVKTITSKHQSPPLAMISERRQRDHANTHQSFLRGKIVMSTLSIDLRQINDQIFLRECELMLLQFQRNDANNRLSNGIELPQLGARH